ncbi:MAG: response regulator transcription factor [Cyclobacteriaceae bacterium]|nr:response regulator transcription factor [Cyclobacteriaceae bacterium]
MKAIALDDELPGLQVLETFCKQTGWIELEKSFTQPSLALRHLGQFPVDILFLDIQMPSVSGLEFSKQIRQNTQVIFTTAFSEFAVEGFNLKATDYLLKPFTYERFEQAVLRAKEQYELRTQSANPADNYLFVRADYKLVKIPTTDILFIEGLDDYIKIHVKDQRPVIARMTMKNVLDKLSSSEFIRVHRSYIVPFKRVANVRNKIISLEGIEVPIGASFEEEFFKRFQS